MHNPARYWREIPQLYRMEAGKCRSCGELYFPPRLVCSKCKGREFETVKLGDEGTIISYSIVRTGSSQFEDLIPYAVGIVELDGGVRITSQIADCDFAELSMGQRVRLEFRRIQEDGDAGIICYGHKCVPC